MIEVQLTILLILELILQPEHHAATDIAEPQERVVILVRVPADAE